MRDYRQLEVEVVGLVLPGLVVLEAKLVGQVKPARRVDQEVALPPLLHLAQVSRVPLACRELQVAPTATIFLDDLGGNLKPASAMGMTTVKVDVARQALAALER